MYFFEVFEVIIYFVPSSAGLFRESQKLVLILWGPANMKRCPQRTQEEIITPSLRQNDIARWFCRNNDVIFVPLWVTESTWRGIQVMKTEDIW